MAILKNKFKDNYSIIPNSIIQAKDLTDAEYRLLIFLYSLPDSWKINQNFLGLKLNCNRININKKIKKLKELGYLEILKSPEKNDYIYILKEKDVSASDVSLKDVSASDVSVSDTYINNNIINTNINNKKDNIYNAEIEEIINYMNQDVLKESNIYGTITFSYKTTTPKTRSLIIARLKEGYTVDDFKDVIFLKYQDWVMDEKNSKQMRKYYRPETLFGNKFENYLQEYKTLE